MRRSTTFAGTKRPLLGGLLLAELLLAAVVVARPNAAAPQPEPSSPPRPVTATALPTATVNVGGGRTAHMIGLGGQRTATLLIRIAAEMRGAADAVTTFWGDDWPRAISIVATASDAQFRAMSGEPGQDTAAVAVADYVDPERRTATGQRIVFAPGAASMSDDALRIVLRHELFHFASRADTALDAPRWLAEGVADFVGRPPTPAPPDASELAQLPTDADLDAAGPVRSLAYDRAWWFSRFVADQYGTSTLRALYIRACGYGHPDVATAVRETLGAPLDAVLTRWRQWLTG